LDYFVGFFLKWGQKSIVVFKKKRKKGADRIKIMVFNLTLLNQVYIISVGYVEADEVGPLAEELINSLVELLVDVPVL
jgi:hypothetical protein